MKNEKTAKELLESFSQPILDHDPKLCGRCQEDQCGKEAALELLKNEDYNLAKFEELKKQKFQKSEIFAQVTAMRLKGLSFEEVEIEMTRKGYIAI